MSPHFTKMFPNGFKFHKISQKSLQISSNFSNFHKSVPKFPQISQKCVQMYPNLFKYLQFSQKRLKFPKMYPILTKAFVPNVPKFFKISQKCLNFSNFHKNVSKFPQIAPNFTKVFPNCSKFVLNLQICIESPNKSSILYFPYLPQTLFDCSGHLLLNFIRKEERILLEMELALWIQWCGVVVSVPFPLLDRQLTY